MERDVILAQLPKVRNKLKLIDPTQTVSKIRKQIMRSHDDNLFLYDAIAPQYVRRSMRQTFEELWSWLRDNIQYIEESGKKQIIKTPQALLETGISDCKSFASFVGGILDAMKRMGKPLDWRYVFAGYGDTNHVFVEADSGGKTYWIDPVLPSFDQREPKPFTIRKFERDMALYTMSGTGKTGCAGCAGKMGITMAQAEDCVLPYESIDQQMIRLTGCQSGGGGGQIIPFSPAQDLYDLPIDTGLPMTSPVDAKPLDPGTPVTMNPPPAPAPPPSPGSDTGFMGWVSENPLLAALIAAGAVYVMTKKKRRRA